MVVIALGTNWTVEHRQVRRALIILGRQRVLGLVTPREVGGARSSDQAVMRAAGERWPRRVKVLDWVRYSSGHANWFWGDGLHLQPRGARALTRLLAPALRWPPPDYDAPPPASIARGRATIAAPAAGSGERARATRPGRGPPSRGPPSSLLIAAIALAAALNAGSARGAESG